MRIESSKKLYHWILVVVVILAIAGLVGHRFLAKKQVAALPQTVDVKAMQVIQEDTALQYEFTGKVQSENEVKIMSKVSGNIVAKMVKGGDIVYKGQPLFRVDNKQYRSAIRSAQGTLNQSRAQLNNAQTDLDRYQHLAAMKGVAQQTVDTQASQVEQYQADMEANEAKLQEAEENEQDTLIVSPVDGRIDVNDLSIGDYVTAGSTTMATVSSMDPVWVQFSMSENEYLKFALAGNGALPDSFKNNIKLTLSNGAEYPLVGSIEQIDKGISDTTGTITLKASFSNPQRLLIPGMFAKVSAQGEMLQGALLIPQRAVKELLGKTFVTVVTDDNKAASRAVELGAKVGNLWLVEKGLTVGERVVVEGMDKAKTGTMLEVTMMGPDELTNPVEQ